MKNFKLNKKGFTLIELLAVIVILAIIVVVTVPTILNSISDARLSSISSLSKEVANQYDTAVAQDLIATEKALGNVTTTTSWQCFDDVTNGATDNNTKKTLTQMLDLSTTDLVTDGNIPGEIIYADTCSAIRVNASGGAEVLLVSKATGKFAISGVTVYAYSTDDNGKKDGENTNKPA